MINYNLVETARGGAIWMYFIITVLFALGNYFSVKMFKPVYPGWGRILFGALILICTNIAFSLIFFQIPLLATIFTLLSWYFEVKFLFGYDWLQAVGAWFMPFLTSIIFLLVLWHGTAYSDSTISALMKYLAIFLVIGVGNYVSMVLWKPKNKGLFMVIVGSITLLIVGYLLTFIKIGMPNVSWLIPLTGSIVWFFVVKYLFGYDWKYAFGAWFMPILSYACVFIPFWNFTKDGQPMISGDWMKMVLGFNAGNVPLYIWMSVGGVAFIVTAALAITSYSKSKKA